MVVEIARLWTLMFDFTACFDTVIAAVTCSVKMMTLSVEAAELSNGLSADTFLLQNCMLRHPTPMVPEMKPGPHAC